MGNVSTWSRTQEAKPSKAAGLSLFSAKASMVISVMFCIVLRAVREFGVEMGHLWHPIALGFRGEERRLPCSWDTQLSLSLCCEYTNRT